MYKGKKIKVMCLLTVLVFAVSILLTGCGNTEGNKTQEGSTQTTQTTAQNEKTQPEEPKLQPATLTWYLGGDPNTVKDMPTVLEAANKILKEKINATLDLKIIDWGSYDQKIKLLIASADPFDLCYTSSWINLYGPNVSKGAFLQLDDMMDKYGKTMTSTVPEKYWDAARVGGKLYAMLNYQIFAYVSGFNISKDMVSKYNFDTKSIKKVEDIEPLFDQIVKNEKGIYCVKGSALQFLQDPDTGAYLDYVAGNGFPMVVVNGDKEYKVLNMYETKAWRAIADRARAWAQKGYIRKDAAIAWKDPTADLKAGKYAATLGMGNLKPGIEDDFKNSFGGNWVSIPIGNPYASQDSIIATMTAVNKNSKNPERAVMLYDLLYSDKNLYNTLCYGVEGKHYTKVADNVINLIADTGYNPGVAWEMGNQFNAYYLNGSKLGIYEETIKINESAVPSSLMGFTLDQEAIKTEMSQITATMSEYNPLLDAGTIDIDKELPKLMDKLKKAGIDKVIQESQRQINEWVKTKQQ